MNRNLNANEPGFLGKKLDGAEWPVDPAAWQAVSAKVTASAAAGTSGAAASTGIFTKAALWVAAVGLAIAAVVAVVRDDAPETSTAQLVQTEEPAAEASEPTATDANAEVLPNTDEAAAPEQRTSAADELPKPATASAETPSVAPKSGTAESDPAIAPRETTIAVSEPQVAHPSPKPTTSSSSSSGAQPTTDAAQPLTVDFDVVFDDNEALEIQFAAILGAPAECEWNFGDGQRGAGESVSHRYTDEGVYTVSVTARDSDGRESSFAAEVEVRLSPKLVLPNIFTPNNDGYNDLLTVAEESRNIAVERMVIIDGSGRVIFQAEGDSAAWDGGLPSGDAAPEGSYRMIVSAVTVAGERIHESAIVRLAR